MDSLRGGPKRGMAVFCLLLLGCAAPIRAQHPTGEIRLEVKDPSGAAMPASGKLQDLASGVVRSFQTDAQGSYAFPSLPYARYRLEVSRGGFATQSLVIEVKSAVPVARSVTMPLGTASAQIDVVATTACWKRPLSQGDSRPRPDCDLAGHRRQRRAGLRQGQPQLA